jgi:NAD(P)H-dependent flavin oxidoreductase YrpB (nitropropane dioxygenase family)
MTSSKTVDISRHLVPTEHCRQQVPVLAAGGIADAAAWPLRWC